MRKIFYTSLSIILFSICINCKSGSKKADVKIEEAERIIQEKKNGEREPTNDEIREYGIIKSIEGGQYPMFVVTVLIPDKKTKANFNLNIETIPQTVVDLDSLRGSFATIYYKDTSKNMLMDIHFNGKTLYGKYAPEIDASFKKITGVLSGAKKETAGDLPSTIYITNTKGAKMAFKEFITSEIVAKNGKTVTGYYYIKNNQTITYIKKREINLLKKDAPR